VSITVINCNSRFALKLGGNLFKLESSGTCINVARADSMTHGVRNPDIVFGVVTVLQAGDLGIVVRFPPKFSNILFY